MLDFVDMVSMARYLFAPNTLPLTNLLMNSNKKALETMFSFQGMQVGADVNQFQLIAGMGEVSGVAVQQLVIDAVSINLAVVGDAPSSLPFTDVPGAWPRFAPARMVVVVDDEDRENEGDLTLAAEFVTPEAINFMAAMAAG
jgi:hypothetical protein